LEDLWNTKKNNKDKDNDKEISSIKKVSIKAPSQNEVPMIYCQKLSCLMLKTD
jgi:hypothetical protein